MIELVWKATLLLLLSLLVVRRAQRAPAAVRHAMLVATFVMLTALPIAVATMPAINVEVLPANGSARQDPAAGRYVSQRTTRPIDATSSPVTEADSSGWALSAGALPLLAWTLWGGGVSAVLLSLVIGIVRVHGLRCSALPCSPTEPVFSIVAAAGRTHVEVVVHEGVAAPITCGVARPAIVLPIDAHEWSASALTRALVHELEHVKRHDWTTQIFARATCAVYWFHPLVWMAYRQMCLEAEHACDDAVVAREESTMYADQLVNLARRMAARPAATMLGMAHRSHLAARVAAVLDTTRSRGPAGTLRAGAIAIAAVACVAGLAPLQLAASTTVAQVRPAKDAPSPTGDSRSPVADAESPAEGRVSAIPVTGPSRQRRSRGALLDRALVEAAAEGDIADVRSLLDDGGNVNAAVDGDGSPLIVAARNDHIDIVRLLLDRGADVNLAVDGDGAPLIMAAREGHLAIVQMLLDRGAEIDRMTAGDENALIQASGAGRLEVVKLLVARGANVNARTWVEQVFGREGASGGHH